MNVKELIGQMTVEEKAGLCSGQDFWHTKTVERLGIPAIMVSDGPHGLRKQDQEADHLGINDSIKAVCFPAGCALAASFDRQMTTRLGEALGEECQAENVAVILGPAVNIKRSPLCGRNFEYYSEDPYLASEIAASHIKGVQSKNVGTSIKHFLANNQEHRRMSSSSEMDERTAREIYLAAFEGAVKQSKPWTVMCSYNRINGTYACENKKYLTDILRDEWGFDGFVVSDWGAVNDRVDSLKAGLELEMPSSFGINDKKIAEAVKAGTLSEECLDEAVERVLNIVYKFVENRNENAVFDKEADHKLSKEIAAECMVLLKNDQILPLDEKENTVFIGAFAKKPRYQGGGSSHINSFKVESALDAVAGMEHITYSPGFITEKDVIDEALIKEAVEAAKKAETAVVFAGLPDSFESEGFDRKHMRLPDCQNELIRQVAAVNKNTVVVLHNGSPVEMPWIQDVKAVLEAYLGGQAVGAATVDILFGKANPCGRLAETFPIRLEDNPSYLYYLGEGDKVEYREGVFVGYRYYDKKKMDVLFPFGHGLSYTSFVYRNLVLDKENMKDTETLRVTVDVTNAGTIKGKEVVQLYVAPLNGSIIRPVRELKGFDKIELNPGETKTVSFELEKRAFAYFDMEAGDWKVENADYEIQIGKSSRDIVAAASVHVESTSKKTRSYNRNTTFGDLMKDEKAMEIAGYLLKEVAVLGDAADDALGESTTAMNEAMMMYMPIRGVITFAQGKVSEEELDALLEKINQITE
ncbi:glycoside hydrolase family 3 C-terminal domain-containing protein [Robinsoniella sp. KNHs210]|uniref:glycoside hydrolase family 3 C-terminal domain-containing protein n=1 Tax=Robinsoniella sp. KNHs210 TaxID=1469950 RepID=UPI0004835E4F|nr:glycoside hydrolase family 3 C-terminal domain-containing protein [Robinsoniella sp. KNHs210]